MGILQRYLLAGVLLSAQLVYGDANARRRLEGIEVSLDNYDHIHHLAVLDQIDNYLPPIRGQSRNQVQSLDGLFDFCLDPQVKGFKEKWFQSKLTDECQASSDYYKMPVPSAFNDIVPNTTVRNYIGWFWYQTEFTAGSPNHCNQILCDWYIQFDNINYMSIVYLLKIDETQSSIVGSHVGGHLPLTIKVQLVPHASYRLTIAVSNMLTRDTIPSGNMIDLSTLVGHDYKQFRPDFDFFHFAGIMGSVELIDVNDMIPKIPDSQATHRSHFWFNLLAGAKQLQGFGMHHEQLFSGRYMNLASIMKDIYLLKQVGANVIRTSHYPYSEAYLDACDAMGIMVIAECPAVGLNSFSEIKLKLHKQILLEMMQRDYHHPSIIMWSVANEPESQHDEARKYFKSLLEYARTNLSEFTVKANRPLTAAIAQSHKDDKIGDLLDVLMINRYYGWYDYMGAIETIRPALIGSLTGWSKKYPDKPMLISEFGAETLAGVHKSTSQIFSEEYQRDLIVEHEKVFDELAVAKNSTGINFIGSMIWNFADFSTHESLSRVAGNHKGIFTQNREPKLSVEAVTKYYKARL